MRTNKPRLMPLFCHRPSQARAFALLGLGLALCLPLGAQAARLPIEGLASWYGLPFHGRATASGEIFNRFEYTAAHKTLAFGTLLLVTNLDNGKKVVVRVTDRGPFVGTRIIDLSEAAALELGMIGSGTTMVRLEDSGGQAAGPLGREAKPGRTEATKVGSEGQQPLGLRAEGSESAPGPYCQIRVASFSSPANAERALERLRLSGYQAEIRREAGYNRLYIPKYPRQEAEDARRRLAELGFPGVLISDI